MECLPFPEEKTRAQTSKMTCLLHRMANQKQKWAENLDLHSFLLWEQLLYRAPCPDYEGRRVKTIYILMDKLYQTGQQKTMLWQEDKVIQSPACLWNCLPGEPKVSLGPGWKEASYQVGSCCLHGTLSLLHTRAYHALCGLLPQRKHVNWGEIFQADKIKEGHSQDLLTLHYSLVRCADGFMQAGS